MLADPARRRQLLFILLGALALASALTGAVLGARESGEPAGDPVPQAGRSEPKTRVSFLARIVPPPAARPEPRAQVGALPAGVIELTRRLPVERKVAQLFAFGFEGTDASADIVDRLGGWEPARSWSDPTTTQTRPSSRPSPGR